MNKPLLITLEYPPQHGGVAKYLESEVNESESDVIVLKAQDMMMLMWPQWLPLLWEARSHYKKNQCDGVWVSHVLPIGYIALIWKKLFKTPYRVYLHGLDLVAPKKSKWKSFWVKKILHNADETITNSNATAQLLSYYGIDSNRAQVQYPRIQNINTQQYHSIGLKLRERYQLNKKPILLTISRLVKRKGINLVIRALPEIWRHVPELVYVVVGDGEERGHLNVIANKVKQSHGAPSSGRARNYSSVIFTGSISEEEKYGWLSACDCFILTPIDDQSDFEGYGIVYKEAQMFNKPVIGSRVGGVPEAIGKNSVLLEPGSVEQIIKTIIETFKKIKKREF
jgi:phosphatidyl-myo-inositol dimannoside synthase